MATATKRPSPSPHAPARNGSSTSGPAGFFRVFDAIYRFLASLKLAMISIGGVAAVLAVGTWIESRFGTVAVQEWVYQSWWFAVLLAFLGTNILCAAMIRFPWTKRQTGFVITHAGLLVVLAGSFWSLQYSDEGQVALTEGSKTTQLVRPDHPVIRIAEFDPHTNEPIHDYEDVLPFRAGALPWGPGRYTLLSDAKSPYKLAVKDHLTASSARVLHEPVTGGAPMLKVGLMIKAPNALREADVFESDSQDSRRWFVAEDRGYRAAKDLGPALVAFQYLNSEEQLDAFLHPPQDLGTEGVALIRYQDKAGKTRTETWKIEGEEGASRILPDSDLTVTYAGMASLPPNPRFSEMTGENQVVLAQFKVRKGEATEVVHYGWPFLPMLPNVLPDSKDSQNPRKELVHVDFFSPLPADRMGLIEVAAMPDGRLFLRALNRKGFKDPIPLKLGTPVQALGGKGMAMSLTFRADQFLPSGRQRITFEQIDLPVGKLNEGIPAAHVELTVDGETKDLWLRRPGGFEPDYKVVTFSSGRSYRVAYDVDRKDLGFTIALDDFDVGLDPGTQEPSSFRSDIRLTDEARGVKDKPVTISMNNTMTHREWTFYQSNYIPLKDPRTDERTGQFMSVFQVGHDAGRPLKYAGCLLVVLGVFTQFYMRAGIFTDGGKRERAIAEAKAAKRARRDAPPVPDEPAVDDEPL